MKTLIRFIMVLAMATTAEPALAGSLDGPGTAPELGSGMPTTAEIYERLNSGAAIVAPGAFREPTAGPTAGTGRSLSEIEGKLPVADNVNGAAITDVLSGKTFWGLRTDGTWGLKTGSVAAGSSVTGADGSLTIPIPDGLYSGVKSATAADSNLAAGNIKSGTTIFGVSGTVIQATGNATAANVLNGSTFSNATASGLTGSMANNGAVTITPGTAAQTIPAGYHNGSGSVAGDANFVTGNIRSGVAIFGVSGKPNVVDTTEATAPAAAANISSGKKAYVNGSLVSGTLQGGYTCTKGDLSPLGRWCDNHDSTVRDMTTGLIWLKDAGWGGQYPFWSGSIESTNAHDRAAQVQNGTPATLTDGSAQGAWRLPTKSELVALTTGTEYIRSKTMYKFTSVQGDFYWSSTAYADNAYYAWGVEMVDGEVQGEYKDYNKKYVWPVRSGQ